MPILLFLDNNPFAQYVLRYAVLAATCALALWPLRAYRPASGRDWTRAGFIAMLLVTLFVFRWTTIAPTGKMDDDEAAMTALAIAATHHPLPWKDFDSVFTGPLNVYVLSVPALAGVTLTLGSSRFMSLLLIWAALALFFAALLFFFSEVAARSAVLPPLTFFALATQPGFAHATTELLSLTLWCAIAALFARAAQRRNEEWPLFAGGVLAGALPFAKLQSLAVAIASVLLGLALIELQGADSPRLRKERSTRFLLCVFVVPIVLIGIALATGAIGDFWISYVRAGFDYRWWTAPSPAWLFFTEGWRAFVFSTLLLIALLAAAVWYFRAWTKAQLTVLGFAAVWLVAGAIAAGRPNSDNPHFLLYFVFPLAALSGCLLGMLFDHTDAIARTLKLSGVEAAWGVPGIFIALSVIGQGALWAPIGFLHSYTYAYYNDDDAITKYLKANTHRGQTASIWGVAAEYYPYAGLVPATRDVDTRFAMYPILNPNKPYFRSRFVEDVEHARPQFFIDSKSRSSDPNESIRTFPELAGLLAREYAPVGTVSGFELYRRRAGA